MPWSQASSPPNPTELFRVVVVQFELAVVVQREPRADPALALRRLALARFDQDHCRLADVARRIGDRLVGCRGAAGEIAHLPGLGARLRELDAPVKPLPVFRSALRNALAHGPAGVGFV